MTSAHRSSGKIFESISSTCSSKKLPDGSPLDGGPINRDRTLCYHHREQFAVQMTQLDIYPFLIFNGWCRGSRSCWCQIFLVEATAGYSKDWVICFLQSLMK
ncbi:hypothetical protein AVEN_84600-1 [Araneus ventricosus]|uniref:Uncharacterized protein n=1 Tax=Araneus ventricosus TaxID=182803 RepID=A0A4Y2C1U2_ARAVE|nr:hypothetical protein AVEN_84600-1 [Araneus ventricosus]